MKNAIITVCGFVFGCIATGLIFYYGYVPMFDNETALTNLNEMQRTRATLELIRDEQATKAIEYLEKILEAKIIAINYTDMGALSKNVKERTEIEVRANKKYRNKYPR